MDALIVGGTFNLHRSLACNIDCAVMKVIEDSLLDVSVSLNVNDCWLVRIMMCVLLCLSCWQTTLEDCLQCLVVCNMFVALLELLSKQHFIVFDFCLFVFAAFLLLFKGWTWTLSANFQSTVLMVKIHIQTWFTCLGCSLCCSICPWMLQIVTCHAWADQWWLDSCLWMVLLDTKVEPQTKKITCHSSIVNHEEKLWWVSSMPVAKNMQLNSSSLV